MDESIQIGERIRAVRKSRQMTQAELAERIGVFPPNVSQIENGSRDPTVRTLAKIAEGLDAPLSALFAEAKEKPGKTDESHKEKIMENRENRIFELLTELGMPASLLGHGYTIHAISLVLTDPKLKKNIVKGLYSEIAAEFDTTPSRVERAIRHAIEVTWDRGDLKLLQRIFGHTVSNRKGKPTNSEFISMLSEYIRRGPTWRQQ